MRPVAPDASGGWIARPCVGEGIPCTSTRPSPRLGSAERTGFFAPCLLGGGIRDDATAAGVPSRGAAMDHESRRCEPRAEGVDARTLNVGLALVFALGGVVVAALSFRSIREGMAQRRWPTVQAEVVNAEVTGRKVRRIRVRFRYEVEDRSYRGEVLLGDEIQIGPAPLFFHLPAPGQVFPVRYDPADPQRTTVRPGSTLGDWTGFLGGAFAVLLAVWFGAQSTPEGPDAGGGSRRREHPPEFQPDAFLK